MKTISLHPLSLAIGGALALGLSLTLAAAPQTQIPPDTTPTSPTSSRPPARDLVFLTQAEPNYEVPEGRILVVTAVGIASFEGRPQVANLPPAVSIHALPPEGTKGSLTAFFRVPKEQGVIELGTGWPIPEGMRVTVTGPDRKNGYRIFMTGYLEDA